MDVTAKLPIFEYNGTFSGNFEDLMSAVSPPIIRNLLLNVHDMRLRLFIIIDYKRNTTNQLHVLCLFMIIDEIVSINEAK